MNADQAIVSIYDVFNRIICLGQHHGESGDFVWNYRMPLTLAKEFPDAPTTLVSTVKASASASKDLTQLFEAAAECKKLAGELPAKPRSPWDESADPLADRANAALNKLYTFANRCGALQPHAR